MSIRPLGIVPVLLWIGIGPIRGLAQAPPSDEWSASAMEWLDLLASARFEEAAARVAEAVPEGTFSAERLEGIWGQLGAQVGALGAVTPKRVTAQDTLQVVELDAAFERSPLLVRVVLTPAHRVTGLWFLPPEPAAYEAPGYVVPDSFVETDLTVGVEGWPLPATLTTPRGEGPFPAVVLVHGSGPHDRDETIGGHRPFRDLAEGLASRGVAVLRYEKRTRTHGARMAAGDDPTPEAEVIDDALSALSAVRTQERIDAERTFVLGHSLGGLLAPEIADRDGRVAGVILAAAPARPVSTLLVDQLQYLLSVDPTRAEELRPLIARAERLAAGELAADDEVLGAPVSYYLDLDARDPVARFGRSHLPYLIVHGGRDYQVTERDFALWREAAANRSTAELRHFPTLNHLFVAGEGMSTPSEYTAGSGHVDAAVIRAIAEWIAGR